MIHVNAKRNIVPSFSFLFDWCIVTVWRNCSLKNERKMDFEWKPSHIALIFNFGAKIFTLLTEEGSHMTLSFYFLTLYL